MAILTGLVVLICLENRGGSDREIIPFSVKLLYSANPISVDTPISESRFSEYFKGFVEEEKNG